MQHFVRLAFVNKLRPCVTELSLPRMPQVCYTLDSHTALRPLVNGPDVRSFQQTLKFLHTIPEAESGLPRQSLRDLETSWMQLLSEKSMKIGRKANRERLNEKEVREMLRSLSDELEAEFCLFLNTNLSPALLARWQAQSALLTGRAYGPLLFFPQNLDDQLAFNGPVKRDTETRKRVQELLASERERVDRQLDADLQWAASWFQQHLPVVKLDGRPINLSVTIRDNAAPFLAPLLLR